jgi:hypothetical protein
MTIRQVWFCGITALISLVGSIVLMAVALDVASMPDAKAVVHYYVAVK